MQIHTLIAFLLKKIIGHRMIKNILNRLAGQKKTVSQAGRNNESNRVQWIEATLKSIPTGSRILDAGAGEQQFKKFCSHLNYVSQDFGEYKPEELDKGLQMQQWDYGKLDIISDIAAIPENDTSFDAIMCIEVFEHIINPRDAIKEFSRLLKPGGKLIITAPFCSLTHFAPYHFYTGFNSFFYEKELVDAGFEIIELTKNGNYFEFLAQELRRLPGVSSKYSNTNLQMKDLDKLDCVIDILDNMSKADTGSKDLLCFGIHVIAIKK